MAPPLLPNLLPVTRLVACSACAQHVKSGESSCPHCGAELRGVEHRALRAAGAVLLGLALSGCGDKDPDTTGDSEGMTGTAETTGSTGDTGATGTDSSGDTTTGGPEPEYGVPMTTAEPDYGVPSTDPTTGDTDTASTGDTDTASTGDTDTATTGGSGEPLYGAGAT